MVLSKFQELYHSTGDCVLALSIFGHISQQLLSANANICFHAADVAFTALMLDVFIMSDLCSDEDSSAFPSANLHKFAEVCGAQLSQISKYYCCAGLPRDQPQKVRDAHEHCPAGHGRRSATPDGHVEACAPQANCRGLRDETPVCAGPAASLVRNLDKWRQTGFYVFERDTVTFVPSFRLGVV